LLGNIPFWVSGMAKIILTIFINIFQHL
jgi:hypothetical protein